MPFSTNFANDLLLFLLNGTALPTYGDDTNFYVSLHVSSPGPTGTQSTHEASYTSYARVQLTRDSGTWTVASNLGTTTGSVDFPTSTDSTPQTVTHIALGVLSSGAGEIIDYKALDAPKTISLGDTPKINTLFFQMVVNE